MKKAVKARLFRKIHIWTDNLSTESTLSFIAATTPLLPTSLSDREILTTTVVPVESGSTNGVSITLEAFRNTLPTLWRIWSKKFLVAILRLDLRLKKWKRLLSDLCFLKTSNGEQKNFETYRRDWPHRRRYSEFFCLRGEKKYNASSIHKIFAALANLLPSRTGLKRSYLSFYLFTLLLYIVINNLFFKIFAYIYLAELVINVAIY